MKVLVAIDEKELTKVNSFEIIDKDYELKEYIDNELCNKFTELSNSDQDDVIYKYKQAKEEGYYGLDVDINLGRDIDTDMRTYNLGTVVEITSKDKLAYRQSDPNILIKY